MFEAVHITIVNQHEALLKLQVGRVSSNKQLIQSGLRHNRTEEEQCLQQPTEKPLKDFTLWFALLSLSFSFTKCTETVQEWLNSHQFTFCETVNTHKLCTGKIHTGSCSIIIRLTHVNVWESKGKPCSCM